MNVALLTFVAIFVIAITLFSVRLGRSVITLPILFALLGIAVGDWGFGWVDIDLHDAPYLHLLTEITLLLILFTDAARIDFRVLKRYHHIPVRLLGLGLPLSILCGVAIGWLIYPELGLVATFLIAIMLAPTDAALGQSVVSNQSVPVRFRQALNVESGLNDGIALPIFVFFICLATDRQDETLLGIASRQLLIGPLVGIAIGYLGARLLDWGRANERITEAFFELSSLAIAVLAFALAELLGGNGFLAAFCGGLTLGNTAKSDLNLLYEFAEAEGQLLTLLTFMFFGAIMLPLAVAHFDWRMLLYAVLALTVMRMLPVSLSLIGLKLNLRTHGFLGWFGPRGIASIIYGLILLESHVAQAEELFNIMVITVALSMLLHGVTAAPFATAFGNAMKHSDEHHKHGDFPELRLRHQGD